MKHTLILGGLALAASASAQTTTPITLNYNFNGIVHAGEAGVPDDPAGYRSISDRGLDFTAGVPADPSLAGFTLVSTPGALDIVHIGNRDTVDGGNRAFDLMPDGDEIGIQPTWLANVNQYGPQSTSIATPILLDNTSTVEVLFQISNGGGTFDVEVGLTTGGSITANVGGPDWFNGPLPGTEGTDLGNPGNNLSVATASIDLSAAAGQMMNSITFSNNSNANGGVAVLAANVVTDPTITVSTPITLNYNFNGVVHAGEAGNPDDPMGFRSISDRALDFSGGVPSNTILDDYSVVDMAGALDCVHLGNRNTVDFGNWAFDPAPDGDDVGIQPTWLTNPDQTAAQTTTLATPAVLGGSSEASFLFQISNGGGSFDVRFEFAGGGSFVTTLSGPDWFGGAFAGTGQVDTANPDNNLSINEAIIDLSGSAGQTVTSISFENSTNGNAGVLILAANLTTEALGTNYCGPANVNSVGSSGRITASGSVVVADNDISLTADLLPQNQFGYFLNGPSQSFIPMPGGSQGNLCLAGGLGRYNQMIGNSGNTGSISLVLDLTNTPTPGGPVAVTAGQSWNFQLWHRDLNPMPTSNFTDAVNIMFQ